MKKWTIDSLKWTIDSLRNEARKLRAAAQTADARLLVFLWHVKNDDVLSGILAADKCPFASFCKEFVQVGRFERFERGFAKLGHDEAKALELGSEAVIAASGLLHDGRAKAYVEACEAWIEDPNQGNGIKKPSLQAAEHMVKQVDPREEVPESLQRRHRAAKEAISTQEENRRLRAQVRELQAENRTLRAENEKLRKKIERLSKNGASNSSRSGTARKRQRSRGE